jgi:hypothetical protein
MSGTEAAEGAPVARRTTLRFAGRTAWVRNLAQPVRVFVATEIGSAMILLAAALAALLCPI